MPGIKFPENTPNPRGSSHSRQFASFVGLLCLFCLSLSAARASSELLEQFCIDCHNPDKSKGDFELSHLGESPTAETLDLWLDALDYVATGEMPPEDDSDITQAQRDTIRDHLQTQVDAYSATTTFIPTPLPPRRLNNLSLIHI